MPITLLLCAIYPFVIQYRKKGFYSLLAPLALLFAILDLIANYTEWFFVFGKPKKGDWSISHRLRTMEEQDVFEARRAFAKGINTFLHACEHDGKH